VLRLVNDRIGQGIAIHVCALERHRGAGILVDAHCSILHHRSVVDRGDSDDTGVAGDREGRAAVESVKSPAVPKDWSHA